MDRVTRVGWAALFGICAIAGCGKDSAPETAASDSSAGIVVQNAADPAANPAARAACEFLDAVIKGNRERAFGQLTPVAQQRIIAKDEHFEPQGLGNMAFRVGEVRTPTESQAIVQCVLTGPSKDGQSKDEEMCCLMRLVDNRWRVQGIAASNGPGHSPMILDFENPPRETPPQPPMAGAPSQNAAAPSAGRPSPPRTAQETPPRYQ
jgi:hypothetical protein